MISAADVFEERLEQPIVQQKVRRKNTMVPLVDKYRPKKLSEIVHQNDVVKTLRSTLKTGDLPHMLFYGPPGTGKTSTILAFVRELFGPKLMEERVMELNASDERGIGTVRGKIARFIKTAIREDKDHPTKANFKIILLDEADSMTSEALASLRVLVEKSKNCRFFFTCNYISKIIDPIISRCSKFRFRPLTDPVAGDRILEIAQQEKIPLDRDLAYHVIRVSSGDMRKAIMLLQNLKYVVKLKEKITQEDIYELAGWVHGEALQNLIHQIIRSSTRMSKLVKIAQDTYRQSYPIQNLHRLILMEINQDVRFDDSMKCLIATHICQVEHKLLVGASEYLILLQTVNMIHRVYHGLTNYLELDLS